MTAKLPFDLETIIQMGMKEGLSMALDQLEVLLGGDKKIMVQWKF